MPKPNDKMNHGQLQDYIRTHGLNKGKNKILVGHKKPLMVEKLKAQGHWETKKAKPKPKLKAPKTTPSKIKMSVKPYGAGKTEFKKPKKAAPKKAAPKKATMTKVLMNYDMDVSEKIGRKVKKVKAATKIQAAARGRAGRRGETYEYTLKGFGLGGGYDDDEYIDSDDSADEIPYGGTQPFLEGWEHDYTNTMGMEWWIKTMTEREAEIHRREYEDEIEDYAAFYREGSGYDDPQIHLWTDPF